MNNQFKRAALTYTSMAAALVVAMACGSDEAPTDVGTATGGAATSTGGRVSAATGGRGAGGKPGTGGSLTGGSAGADASAGGGTSGAGGTVNPEGGPDVSAGGQAGAGGAGGTGGTDAGPTDCFTNPTTHFEIINACTTAEKVDKNPTLPLNLADGGLKPLP